MTRHTIRLRKKQILQLIRYGLVGISSNLGGYAVFLLITALGLHYKLAMTLLYMVGIVIGFLGNKKWVFSYQGGLEKAGYKYVFSHLFGYLLNLSILLFFVDFMGYSYRIVQAIAILIVGFFLFFLYKFFVFGDREDSSGSRKKQTLSQRGK